MALRDRNSSPSICGSIRGCAYRHRSSVHCPALGLAKWLGRGGDGIGVVFDVSMRGAKVMSEAGIQRGDRVSVSLSLPNQVSPMTVEEATVRWEKEQVYGLEFVDLSPVAEMRLRKFITHRDETGGLTPASVRSARRSSAKAHRTAHSLHRAGIAVLVHQFQPRPPRQLPLWRFPASLRDCARRSVSLQWLPHSAMSSTNTRNKRHAAA